jgi:hypothetical protein
MAAARVLDTHGNTVEMTIVPSLVKLCSDPDLEVRARAHVVLGVQLTEIRGVGGGCYCFTRNARDCVS